MSRYQLIPRFCATSGYTDKAVRRKIEEGVWIEGREYRRAPDGHIVIDLEAVPPLDAPEPIAACAVYILYRGDAVAYVGRSIDPQRRLGEHLKRECDFDRAEIIPCDELTSIWLERELIRVLRPAQNRIQYERHAADAAWQIARGGECMREGA